MDFLVKLLQMGGYSFYVWSAYGLVLGILALQLLLPWRRWQKMNKKPKNSVNE